MHIFFHAGEDPCPFASMLCGLSPEFSSAPCSCFVSVVIRTEDRGRQTALEHRVRARGSIAIRSELLLRIPRYMNVNFAQGQRSSP